MLTTTVNPRRRAARVAAAASLAVALVAWGCGLDDVTIPEFDGPSGQGLDLSLEADPDLLTADGFSTSLITARLFGPDGRPLGGRQIFFTVGDEDGAFADIGTFPASNGPGTGITVSTDGSGVAQVIYQAPPRTDATAHQTVVIAARPVGTGTSGQFYRSVRVELRSAEPRLFPQTPGNILPNCLFAVEAPGGFRTHQAILFQTTASDDDGVIVRYEWFFGDGSGGPSYTPDAAHVYRTPGSYTVTHRVTDDDGGQNACATTLTIR